MCCENCYLNTATKIKKIKISDFDFNILEIIDLRVCEECFNFLS